MIYFLRCAVTGLVKVGFSKTDQSLFTRVVDLCVASSTQAQLVSVIDGSMEEEREFHIEHRSSWSHGEWFRLTEWPESKYLELVEKINARKPAPKFTERACVKCGVVFGLSWSSKRKWCGACKPAPGAELSVVKAAAVYYGVSSLAIRKWIGAGFAIEAAAAAAKLDDDFERRLREACSTAGCTREAMKRRLASMSFEDAIDMGPPRKGPRKGKRFLRGLRTDYDCSPICVEPLATYFTSTAETIRELEVRARVSYRTILRARKGHSVGPTCAKRLGAATGIDPSVFRTNRLTKNMRHTPSPAESLLSRNSGDVPSAK